MLSSVRLDEKSPRAGALTSWQDRIYLCWVGTDVKLTCRFRRMVGSSWRSSGCPTVAIPTTGPAWTIRNRSAATRAVRRSTVWSRTGSIAIYVTLIVDAESP
jgi:hypothetical protein